MGMEASPVNTTSAARTFSRNFSSSFAFFKTETCNQPRKPLTSVDGLGGLLIDGASVVHLGFLGGDTGGRAVGVEVAVVVHGLLEAVAFPAEDVIAVGSGATKRLLVSFALPAMDFRGYWKKTNIPKVHAVQEWRAGVGPHALVKLADVPHELVHDLGELDGVSRRAGTATAGPGTAVGNVRLVVR